MGLVGNQIRTEACVCVFACMCVCVCGDDDKQKIWEQFRLTVLCVDSPLRESQQPVCAIHFYFPFTSAVSL